VGASIPLLTEQAQAQASQMTTTMASTILDRLMHRSRLLEFEGKSYRLKEAAQRLAIKTPAD
jgi:DNA replication protein DnaC